MATNDKRLFERYDVCEPYLIARIKALRMPPAAMGIKLTNDKQVYGVVIDIPMGPDLLGTLICLPNGTANIYFNNGGTITNLSQRHPVLAQTVRTLIASAGQSLEICERTSVFDLPANSSVHYVHLMTRKGVYKTTINPITAGLEGENLKLFLLHLYQKVMNEIKNAQMRDQQAAGKAK